MAGGTGVTPSAGGQRHRQGDAPAVPSHPQAPTTKHPPIPHPPPQRGATRQPWGPGWDTGAVARGGHREVVPPPAGSSVASLCNIIAAAGSRGDASPSRRALTPAADTPGIPQLPAPRARRNSRAEPPRPHSRRQSPRCRSARPAGPPPTAVHWLPADGQTLPSRPQAHAEGPPAPRHPQRRRGQDEGYTGMRLLWLLRSRASPPDAGKEKPQALMLWPQPLGALISTC